MYYSFKLRTVDTIITFHVNAAFKYCTGFNISDFTAIAPVCIYIYIYIYIYILCIYIYIYIYIYCIYCIYIYI